MIAIHTSHTSPAPGGNIPQELQERDKWLVWRYETVNGNPKPTKVPYQPATGAPQKASSTDPATWWSYFDACWVLDTQPEYGYDGIGFVVTAEDPYTGVDLDHCRNPQTGAIEERASTSTARRAPSSAARTN